MSSARARLECVRACVRAGEEGRAGVQEVKPFQFKTLHGYITVVDAPHHLKRSLRVLNRPRVSQGFPFGHVDNYSYNFEEPTLYALIFLLFFVNGPGPLSVDSFIYKQISQEPEDSE